MPNFDLSLLSYVKQTVYEINVDCLEYQKKEKTESSDIRVRVGGNFKLMGLELAALVVNLAFLPFELIAKAFLSVAEMFCNKDALEGTLASKIILYQESVSPLQTTDNIRSVFIGFLSTLLYGWTSPEKNIGIHQGLNLATPITIEVLPDESVDGRDRDATVDCEEERLSDLSEARRLAGVGSPLALLPQGSPSRRDVTEGDDTPDGVQAYLSATSNVTQRRRNRNNTSQQSSRVPLGLRTPVRVIGGIQSPLPRGRQPSPVSDSVNDPSAAATAASTSVLLTSSFAVSPIHPGASSNISFSGPLPQSPDLGSPDQGNLSLRAQAAPSTPGPHPEAEQAAAASPSGSPNSSDPFVKAERTWASPSGSKLQEKKN